jgi:hypothetical protein
LFFGDFLEPIDFDLSTVLQGPGHSLPIRRIQHAKSARDCCAELTDPILIVSHLIAELVARSFEGDPKMRESRGVLAEGIPTDHIEQARSSRRPRVEIHAKGRLDLLSSHAWPTIDARDIVPEAVLIELKKPRAGRQGPR